MYGWGKKNAGGWKRRKGISENTLGSVILHCPVFYCQIPFNCLNIMAQDLEWNVYRAFYYLRTFTGKIMEVVCVCDVWVVCVVFGMCHGKDF